MSEREQMEPQNAREMELSEWCAKLPRHHSVNQRLRVLEHCRSHPLRWAVWDLLRRRIPFVRWKSPLAREGSEG